MGLSIHKSITWQCAKFLGYLLSLPKSGQNNYKKFHLIGYQNLEKKLKQSYPQMAFVSFLNFSQLELVGKDIFGTSVYIHIIALWLKPSIYMWFLFFSKCWYTTKRTWWWKYFGSKIRYPIQSLEFWYVLCLSSYG